MFLFVFLRFHYSTIFMFLIHPFPGTCENVSKRWFYAHGSARSNFLINLFSFYQTLPDPRLQSCDFYHISISLETFRRLVSKTALKRFIKTDFEKSSRYTISFMWCFVRWRYFVLYACFMLLMIYLYDLNALFSLSSTGKSKIGQNDRLVVRIYLVVCPANLFRWPWVVRRGELQLNKKTQI